VHEVPSPITVAVIGSVLLVPGVMHVHGLPVKQMIRTDAAALLVAKLWN
jgi:hypothetical protein